MATERRLVSLTTDIVIEVPVDLDTESKEGQDLLRGEFIEFLQLAENIQLSFEVGDKED